MRPEPILLTGHDAEVASWVAQRIPHMHGGDFGPCAAIGVGRPGSMYAGVVFHEYQPAFKNIQLSMAADSPLWATRNTIKALLSYPFNRLGVWMVWTLTPIENVRALKVNEHIGFKRKPIVPHVYGPRKHAIICQMTQPEFQARYGVSTNGKA